MRAFHLVPTSQKSDPPADAIEGVQWRDGSVCVYWGALTASVHANIGVLAEKLSAEGGGLSLVWIDQGVGSAT